MSRLLGPDSDTTNNVSDRASAFALDQIAGADTNVPAAAPDIDFRKSRRFMPASNRPCWSCFTQCACQAAGGAPRPGNLLKRLSFRGSGQRIVAAWEGAKLHTETST